MVLFVGKIRRGNYIFISWIGDHGHHVHVFRDKKMVLKWDLSEKKVMEGKITKKIFKIIAQLLLEGKL
jgi:hypothetical protein